ncbi:N-acetylmannosamine-6-phosphate 2-epimerase [Fredinandcohnia humi]
MNLIEQLKGKLIVSCQALEDEPLHGSKYMAKMALAAKVGGAAGIRANGVSDVREIKQMTGLPVIGIIKKVYQDSEVYITPTLSEVKDLLETKAEIIALDATLRKRPNGEKLAALISYIKQNSQAYVMGDISTFEEGLEAINLGVDLLSTTLSGYTQMTRHIHGPNFSLLESLVKLNKVPVIAEGQISTPSQAVEALQRGAQAVVVGTAITRPQVITEQFVNAIKALT